MKREQELIERKRRSLESAVRREREHVRSAEENVERHREQLEAAYAELVAYDRNAARLRRPPGAGNDVRPVKLSYAPRWTIVVGEAYGPDDTRIGFEPERAPIERDALLYVPRSGEILRVLAVEGAELEVQRAVGGTEPVGFVGGDELVRVGSAAEA